MCMKGTTMILHSQNITTARRQDIPDKQTLQGTSKEGKKTYTRWS